MARRAMLKMLTVLIACGAALCVSADSATAAQPGQPSDWNRFMYYPYVYYPHNFQRPVTYDHMYYRYPPNRRIPVYNKGWHNFYPTERPYHSGHHFILDVF